MEIGRLSVGVGPAMAESFVTNAIARLAETHPSAHIVARVDHASQLSDWLRAGELDLFVADVTHLAGDHEFIIVPMPSEQFIWFCRRGHPLAKSKRVTRKDLLAYPLVTPRMPTWARQWFKQSLDVNSPPDPDQSFGTNRSFNTVECENYSMLKRMVHHQHRNHQRHTRRAPGQSPRSQNQSRHRPPPRPNPLAASRSLHSRSGPRRKNMRCRAWRLNESTARVAPTIIRNASRCPCRTAKTRSIDAAAKTDHIALD
jgi:hypothetical protein